MTDSNATPGLGDLLNLIGGANPLGSLSKNLEAMKKGIEGFVTSVQSFSSSMEELDTVVKRVTALLDDIEAPLRNFAATVAVPESETDAS
jgi:hypothetical protein